MTEPLNPTPTGNDTIITGNVSGTGISIGQNATSIVVIHQQNTHPLPVNLSVLKQPLIEHYTAAVFGGRDAELAALDDFLDDPNHPFGLLVAPAGLGKTALLVNWIARVQKLQWRVVFVPVSIRYQTASEQVTLSMLAHGLAEIHNDLDEFRKNDQASDRLRALIIDYLRRQLPDGTNLLLVLDGIDEALGWTVGPLLSIASPPYGLKIVVSARQLANATRENWLTDLKWDTAKVRLFDLRPLDQPAIKALLAQSVPELATDPSFVAQFYRVSEGDPLTANLLIKALTSREITPESLTRRPPGLEAFLKDWVDTLDQRQQDSSAICELLALCAAAYGPLTSDDLQALEPEVFKKQTSIVRAVRDNQVARFIITVGEHTYVFSHPRLREVFLEQIYPPKDRAKLQQRLIDYGKAWYADRRQPLPAYLRQFWILHLKEGGEWETMRQVLTEIVQSADGRHFFQPWQVARHAAEGNDTGYLSDLDILWRHAEEQGDLELMLRCALIATSLRSRACKLLPELLVQLVKVGTAEGKWSAAAALEQVAQMTDRRKLECLPVLLESGIDLSWERALEIARAIADEYRRALVLAVLIPHLPSADQMQQALRDAIAAAQATKPNDLACDLALREIVYGVLCTNQVLDLRDDALAAARAITDNSCRAEALTDLAPHLPSDDQAQALADALAAACAVTHDEFRAEAIANLAPHLPPSLLADALAAARAITDNLFRARALTDLAPHLPTDDRAQALADALAAARAITDNSCRAEALTNLAPHLPTDDRAQALADALAAARDITDNSRCARALTNLAQYLPSTDRAQALADALAAARDIAHDQYRAKALANLAPHLPTDDRAQALADALAAARAISDNWSRAEALTNLAPQLLPADKAQALCDALAAARNIICEERRAEALVNLAPYLPPTDQKQALADALAAVRTIADNRYRAHALANLAQYLPSADQAQVLADALATAQAITREDDRARALANLAQYLPFADQAQVLADALATACDITDEYNRARTLAALAPHLTPPLLTDALAAARAITDERSRAEALAALAQYLPSTGQAQVLTNALAAARAEAKRVRARYLPAELPTDALTTALAIYDEEERAHALAALAPRLAEVCSETTELFARTLRHLAQGGRPDLLHALTALTPWIVALGERRGQAAAKALAQAIVETGRCWP